MPRTTILVPRGAEAAAVRCARPAARVVDVPAGAAAASALPEFEEGETVVVMGLCGALRDLRAGDVAIYRRTADAHGAFDLDAGLIRVLAAALPHASVANACTTDRVVTTAAARTALAERFDADAVDMEGTHLAAALAARGARFACVRVVSDGTARDLPRIDAAVDAQGRVQPVRIALAFARAPLASAAFVRDVLRALRVLTDTVRAIDRVCTETDPVQRRRPRER